MLLVDFHHLLNEYKRETIVQICVESELCGWSRAGTPGKILVSGGLSAVSELVDWLRIQRWQTMRLSGLVVGAPELPAFSELECTMKVWEATLEQANVDASTLNSTEATKLVHSVFGGAQTYSEKRVEEDLKTKLAFSLDQIGASSSSLGYH